MEGQRTSKRTVFLRDVVRMILRSTVETGTPFAFNRDLVNGADLNSHKGMIYCSNLCTEIIQNMEAIKTVSTEIVDQDGDTMIMNITRAGEFAIHSLASLYLRNIDVTGGREAGGIVFYAVRMLDNVMDLNFYPLPYAEVTNRRHRSIGLGVSDYHHMLIKHGIRWESEERIIFAGQVFERINYAAAKASNAIDAKKGSYVYSQGSKWQARKYFEKRGYVGGRWWGLIRTMVGWGMRNAYLVAATPTSSTSILSGTTAGLGSVMKRFYLEEKKDSIMPRIAPELTMSTFWLYESAYAIDQTYTVRVTGARQRHINQAQSANPYITNEYTMRQLSNLYILTWEQGVKTLYYVRS